MDELNQTFVLLVPPKPWPPELKLEIKEWSALTDMMCTLKIVSSAETVTTATQVTLCDREETGAYSDRSSQTNWMDFCRDNSTSYDTNLMAKKYKSDKGVNVNTIPKETTTEPTTKNFGVNVSMNVVRPIPRSGGSGAASRKGNPERLGEKKKMTWKDYKELRQSSCEETKLNDDKASQTEATHKKIFKAQMDFIDGHLKRLKNILLKMLHERPASCVSFASKYASHVAGVVRGLVSGNLSEVMLRDKEALEEFKKNTFWGWTAYQGRDGASDRERRESGEIVDSTPEASPACRQEAGDEWRIARNRSESAYDSNGCREKGRCEGVSGAQTEHDHQNYHRKHRDGSRNRFDQDDDDYFARDGHTEYSWGRENTRTQLDRCVFGEKSEPMRLMQDSVAAEEFRTTDVWVGPQLSSVRGRDGGDVIRRDASGEDPGQFPFERYVDHEEGNNPRRNNPRSPDEYRYHHDAGRNHDSRVFVDRGAEKPRNRSDEGWRHHEGVGSTTDRLRGSSDFVNRDDHKRVMHHGRRPVRQEILSRENNHDRRRSWSPVSKMSKVELRDNILRHPTSRNGKSHSRPVAPSHSRDPRLRYRNCGKNESTEPDLLSH